MRPFLFLPLLCLLLLSNTEVFAQADAVYAAQAARFRAQEAKNGAALEPLLHEDLYYLHSNGLIETKEDFITSVNSGKIVYRRMQPSEQQLEIYGKTAVLTGLVLVDGQYQGKDFNIGLYYTSVYRKKRGKWQLVNWQSTRKPD